MFKSTRVLQQVAANGSTLNRKAYDVCVVGGALVGSTLCRALESSKYTHELSVALIDRPSHFERMNNYRYNELNPGLRCSALNSTSISLLEQLGVWSQLASKTTYSTMNVFDRNNYMISFHAADVSSSSLGAMVDNDELNNVLLRTMTHVQRFEADKTVVQNSSESSLVNVNVGNEQITSKVVVGCDGRDSIVNKVGNFSSLTRRYPLSSFVCTVVCDAAYPAAFQKFSDRGILALLPMSSMHPLYNVVFTTSNEYAQELNSLPEEELINHLRSIWNMPNDAPSIIKLNTSAKGYFPLFRSHVDQYYAWDGKLFVLGDAAHSMLPIAGQGLNSGMYDITEYIKIIQDNIETGHEISKVSGNYRNWWWRNESTIRGVEAIREAYGVGEIAQHIPRLLFLDTIRQVGLKALTLSPTVRKLLIEQAMGQYAGTNHIGGYGVNVVLE